MAIPKLRYPSFLQGRKQLIVLLLILLIGVVFIGMLYNQNRLLQAQAANQKTIIDIQTNIIQTAQNNNLLIMMSDVLRSAESELKQNDDRILTATSIDRIVYVSELLQAYQYLENDSAEMLNLSPERGQLLVSLAMLNMDSLSFEAIKARASFEKADLRAVDLNAMDLSGINLRGANLSKAKLNHTQLNNADLRSVNFGASDLKNANLSESYLNRADFRWANLNYAKLTYAVLNGADFSQAKMNHTDMNGASFRWAKAKGALLHQANLSCMDLKGTNFSMADLSESNLKGSDLGSSILIDADLRKADMIGANLKGFNEVQMEGALVLGSDWLEKLKEWEVRGAEEVKARFATQDNTSGDNAYFITAKID